MPVHSILMTQKSQTATRPADPEEAPSVPKPEPTPEHPDGHPNLPTQNIQPGTPPIPNVLRFFIAVFYSILYV